MEIRSRFKGILTLFILFYFNDYLSAQTFINDEIETITDQGTINYPISVAGLSNIDTTHFGLQSISFNIEHEDNSQLSLYLESPTGKSILLLKKLPGSNFIKTTLDATSNIYIDFGKDSYTGNFRSINDISLLNNLSDPNGVWNLVVKDDVSGVVGNILNASLVFGNAPAKPILATTNLPIIIINTNNVEINNSKGTLSNMIIIYNGEGEWNNVHDNDYYYDGNISIKIRGSSSQIYPKKQYGFDTMNEDGTEDFPVSLLGLPVNSDWVLSATYQDKTMMRNPLTYQIAREMGSYAARTIYCELIINDEYRGVFIFQEKNKRDKNRVDVEKLTSSDISEPNVSGGYIFKLDGIDYDEIFWRSEVPDPIGGLSTAFIYVYPKKEKDLQPEQRSYIESFVNSFEQSLLGDDFANPSTGFRKYIDEYSFIDYLIINELSNNIDGYRKSAYFYKKRNEPINAGPVWDYDLAWGNANYFGGNSSIGYRYSYQYPANDFRVPFWWKRMMDDPVWKQNMICRYRNLRNNILSLDNLNSIIDSLHSKINLGQERNFIRWNILGKYVNGNPSPIPPDYISEVNNLKSFIQARLNFLDSDLGICAALNLTLFDFYGIGLKNSVELNWSAMSDEEGDYFQVERSINGTNFIKVGMINVKNNQQKEKINYQFFDTNPEGGINIYRLRMVSKDGGITYSKSINIEMKITKWTLHPNKISTTLILQSPIKGDVLIKINIFNNYGQLVRTTSVRNNTIIRYDLNNLQNGIYLLEIINNDGKREIMKFAKE